MSATRDNYRNRTGLNLVGSPELRGNKLLAQANNLRNELLGYLQDEIDLDPECGLVPEDR